MKKTVLVLVTLTVLAKMFGFARDVVLSYFYGVSNISDIYMISMTIPLTIFAFIGKGILTNYIPMYSNIEKENDTEMAHKFTSNIINLVFVVSTFLVLITILFTSSIVKLFASGFSESTLQIANGFTRISILGIYFSGSTYILSGYLHLRKVFSIPMIANVVANVFSIITIFISIKSSIWVLATGSVIAVAFELILLIPSARREKYRYKLILDISDKHLIRMILLSIPVIIGVSVNQINVLINTTLASRIAVGGISALTYSNRINLVIQGIFVASIATTIYPTISKMSMQNNTQGLRNTLRKSVNIITIIIVPTTIGMIIFAKPLVRLLFGRGAFSAQAVDMTSSALMFYSIGMIGVALREVFTKVFYAFQDTRTPMINAVIGIGSNIVLNIFLSRHLGIDGLALGASISAIITTVLMFISMRKKIGLIDFRLISYTFVKVLFASLIMGGVAKLWFSNFDSVFSYNLSFFSALGVGVIVYCSISYFMRIEEIDAFINDIKRKFISFL